ncbi:MAG: bacteriohemerythrin [Candidatus Thermoplasmatota archaeon]
MALMNWDASFSVNVKEIDIQHQRLVEMLNQLHELMKVGQGKTAIAPILDELITYAGTHFSTEEKYFDQFRFSEAVRHKAEHKQFVQKVLAFQNDFKTGRTVLTMDVMNFLRDWLVNHIKGTDKRYSQCFNEHGLY